MLLGRAHPVGIPGSPALFFFKGNRGVVELGKGEEGGRNGRGGNRSGDVIHREEMYYLHF